MRMLRFFIIFLLYSIFYPLTSNAQLKNKENNPPDYDSSYLISYNHELTLRAYLSQKYTGLSIDGSDVLSAFRYRPNTTLNLGIGATYNSLSLNLAYGIPGLNGNSSERGKTKYLDLQSHYYGRKLVFDLFGQFYKGYYLTPKNYLNKSNSYYIKPDLGITMLGITGFYIFNSNKFSYRAMLLQNEWQKKSAGTFLIGLSFFYGIVNSDNGIIPNEVAAYFPQGRVKKLRFINFGPGLGYAYTFVYKKHWFATASLTANLTLDLSKELTRSGIENPNTSISTNFIYRVGLGYNSQKWTYNISLVNNSVIAEGAASSVPYVIRTGNVRVTVAKRILLTREIKKIIQPATKILNKD